MSNLLGFVISLVIAIALIIAEYFYLFRFFFEKYEKEEEIGSALLIAFGSHFILAWIYGFMTNLIFQNTILPIWLRYNGGILATISFWYLGIWCFMAEDSRKKYMNPHINPGMYTFFGLFAFGAGIAILYIV